MYGEYRGSLYLTNFINLDAYYLSTHKNTLEVHIVGCDIHFKYFEPRRKRWVYHGDMISVKE